MSTGAPDGWGMTLFLRALFLGFGVATGAAFFLHSSGMALWAAVLIAWVGGNVLGLAFTAAGATLWPAKPARRASFTATADEFRLWDDDLACELIDAGLRHDEVPAAAQGASAEGIRAAG
jgi:hypothetical protein